jgi:hypothetical protein
VDVVVEKIAGPAVEKEVLLGMRDRVGFLLIRFKGRVPDRVNVS